MLVTPSFNEQKLFMHITVSVLNSSITIFIPSQVKFVKEFVEHILYHMSLCLITLTDKA